MTEPEPDDDLDLGSAAAGEHPTLFQLRSGQCRFPIGGPREPARFFRGKPAVLPKPYCRECCERAYVVLPVRNGGTRAPDTHTSQPLPIRAADVR